MSIPGFPEFSGLFGFSGVLRSSPDSFPGFPESRGGGGQRSLLSVWQIRTIRDLFAWSCPNEPLLKWGPHQEGWSLHQGLLNWISFRSLGNLLRVVWPYMGLCWGSLIESYTQILVTLCIYTVIKIYKGSTKKISQCEYVLYEPVFIFIFGLPCNCLCLTVWDDSPSGSVLRWSYGSSTVKYISWSFGHFPLNYLNHIVYRIGILESFLIEVRHSDRQNLP